MQRLTSFVQKYTHGNGIQGFVRDAWDTFRFFAWPRSVRRINHPNKNSRVWRFPAPASEFIDRQENYIDFKTAYKDSNHHIRYTHGYQMDLDDKVLFNDPIGQPIETKLYHFGFLELGQVNDASAVESARAKFEECYGFPVEEPNHRDDLDIKDLVPRKGNREQVYENVVGMFEFVRVESSLNAWLGDLDELYNMKFYNFLYFSQFACDPVMRQVQLEQEEFMENLYAKKMREEKQPYFKGDAAFWTILDDSHSEETIRRIQGSVKNYVGERDLTPVHYGEGEIPAEPSYISHRDTTIKTRYLADA